MRERKIWLLLLLLALGLPLAGCGEQIFFEKIDRQGHVRIERDGVGYCFRVPTEWEIRERLEEADVVCMAPLEDGFRDSIIARTLPASALEDPEQVIDGQLEGLGGRVSVVEPWAGPDRPMVVTLEETRFSQTPLGQLLFLHLRPDGSGVLIVCTTTRARLSERRDFFTDIVNQAEYDLADCAGPGALPEVFPTPEVTFTPAP